MGVAMGKKGVKVTVSERALLARLQRVLAKRQWPQYIHITRNWNMLQNYGRFILLDTRTNTLKDGTNDLARWGEKYGVLAEFEELEPRDRTTR